MKEAAGEANMTIITILLIAVVFGLGSVIITNLLGDVGEQSSALNTGVSQS